MTHRLSIFDVLLQVAIAAAIHGLRDDVWTLDAFARRLGIVVPIALLLIGAYRWAISSPERQ